MKTIFVGFLMILSSFTSEAQQYFGTPAAEGHRNIVLMNPTINNLQTIIYLIENQIFPLRNDYHIVGFYQKMQAYNFQESADFIRESGRTNLFLQACDDLPGDALFAQNPCSDDFQAVFAGSEGVIFFGGPDIPPSIYGEETNLLTEITDYHRHTFEASFLFHLLGGYQSEEYTPFLEQKPAYRILGICLGMQTMNVATGGTLIQDIPTETYDIKTVEQALAVEPDDRHRNYNTNFGTDDELIWGHFHRIKINSDHLQSFITDSDSAHPYVLSSHHQGAGRIGKGMVPAATSMDGQVVEALIHDSYPNVIGLQFHPEPVFLYQSESKLKFATDQAAKDSYIDLFGGGKGENFNRNIWRWMGEIYW